MTPEVSEWMRQAAAEIGEVCDISHLREPEMAEIIARHFAAQADCPSPESALANGMQQAIDIVGALPANYTTVEVLLRLKVALAESALASAAKEK